jgi:hypothetical protein
LREKDKNHGIRLGSNDPLCASLTDTWKENGENVVTGGQYVAGAAANSQAWVLAAESLEKIKKLIGVP